MLKFARAARLWDGKRTIKQPLIRIEDGLIASIQTGKTPPPSAEILDFPSGTLAPAFFDVHIHGAAGHDFMEATPEALRAIGSFLATKGCAGYLATTVTAPLDKTLRALSGLAKLIETPSLIGAEQPSARPLGIHL